MTGLFRHAALLVVATIEITLLGCGAVPIPGGGADPSALDNTGAAYLGLATCSACHFNPASLHAWHGHSQALKRTEGTAPTYATGTAVAGIPSPPIGFEWFDISFVIGGYAKAANFVDAGGYILTDGTAGTRAQYNLASAPGPAHAGFVPFLPDQTSPLPYDYACFRCHTTGPESVDTNGGFRQDNLPGAGGTWAEEGVQCEACHGPGSRHLADPSAGYIVVDATSVLCGNCHAGVMGPDVLEAAGGFVVGNQQYAELAAGPHRGFACTVCHDPHASIIYDRDNGLRNRCRDCHANANMAFHQENVFVQGDYVEWLSCESCHMPPASRNASAASADVTGAMRGRIGDTRTHVFFIDTINRDYSSMFTADGKEVVTNEEGSAAVTLDFVCLRCHNGLGSAFELTLWAASAVAEGIHDSP